MEQGQWLLASLNAVASNVLCLAAVLAGAALVAGCRMASAMAVQVTMYLTEGDSWHHRPLHLEILKYLREENVFGAVALHAVAGFLGRGRVHTAHLVEAGGQLS